jgi:hypothetical protein
MMVARCSPHASRHAWTASSRSRIYAPTTRRQRHESAAASPALSSQLLASVSADDGVVRTALTMSWTVPAVAGSHWTSSTSYTPWDCRSPSSSWVLLRRDRACPTKWTRLGLSGSRRDIPKVSCCRFPESRVFMGCFVDGSAGRSHEYPCAVRRLAIHVLFVARKATI